MIIKGTEIDEERVQRVIARLDEFYQFSWQRAYSFVKDEFNNGVQLVGPRLITDRIINRLRSKIKNGASRRTYIWKDKQQNLVDNPKPIDRLF